MRNWDVARGSNRHAWLWLFGFRVVKQAFIVASKECRCIQFVRLSSFVGQKLHVIVFPEHGLPLRIQVLPLRRTGLILLALCGLGRQAIGFLSLVCLVFGLGLFGCFLQGGKTRTGRGHIQGLQHIHGRLSFHGGRLEVVLLCDLLTAHIVEEVVLFRSRILREQVMFNCNRALLCCVLLCRRH
jgi:hypothetical protein